MKYQLPVHVIVLSGTHELAMVYTCSGTMYHQYQVDSPCTHTVCSDPYPSPHIYFFGEYGGP